ncbi:MAG: ankyrin repeat domain-containing protein, partial [Chloroflexota bacterium]
MSSKPGAERRNRLAIAFPAKRAILTPMRFRFISMGFLLSLGMACGWDDTDAAREHRLLRAARNGYMGDIRTLLDQGVDIETRNPSDGWTPLFWAAVRDNAPAVKLLASRGANMETRDRRGLTALMHASRWGHKEGVVALLDAGANIEAVDGNGWSALMWTAFKGQTEMVAFLLDRGADLDVREVTDHDAAVEALADFLGFVLFATQRADHAGEDHLAAAENARLAVAEHRAVDHVAAGDRADLRRLEQRSDFGVSSDLFGDLGRERAFH